MEFLGAIFNRILDPVFALFKVESFAPFLAMIITLMGLGLLAYFGYEFWKQRRQIKSFTSAILSIESESEFAFDWADIEKKIESKKIGLVWGEYLETCIMPDVNDPRINQIDMRVQNTFRPHEYFNLPSIFPPNAISSSLPNLFVGAGLVVTFMGLVAALATSAEAIFEITQERTGTGQSAALMDPILELLRQASTKFYASFTALFFSLAISLELKWFQVLLERPLEKVNEHLEGLVRYSPLEKIATEQLTQAQQQTEQLRAFNTNLATQIGERVQQALQQSMSGVITQLGEISTNLGAANVEALQAAGKEIAEQTRGAAEESLKTLANRLNLISQGMQGLPAAISGGTDEFRARMRETFDEANEQATENIRATGEASRTLIEELLGGLNSSIQELTDASRESSMQLRNAAVGINESVSLLTEAMRSGSEAAAQSMSDGAQQFGESAAEGARAANEAFTAGASNFKNAVVEAGREVAKDAGDQIAKGTKDAVDTIAGSLSAPLSNLTNSASSFSNDINSLNDRMQLLMNSTSSLAGITQESSNSVSNAIQQLNQVVSQSSTIMESLQTATAPLPEAISTLIQENGERQEEYASLLVEIRGFNENTNTQAQQLLQTWEGHKTRFAEIDSGLTTAFGALSEQIQQYVQSTQTITNDIDSKLGAAVGQLGGMVEDLTNALEEFRSEEQANN